MSKFEEYLEATRDVVINENNKSKVYSDLVKLIRESTDNEDREIFVEEILYERLDSWGFEVDKKNDTAERDGVTFVISRIISVLENKGKDWYRVKPYDLESAEI